MNVILHGVSHQKRNVFKRSLLTWKCIATFLLVIMLQISVSAFSQQVSLSFKNASLQQIFSEINAQTGSQFFIRMSCSTKQEKSVST